MTSSSDFSRRLNRLSLSIVVTHYRSPDKLGACLASILTNASEYGPEIVVCDSDTNGEAQAVVERFPGVELIQFHKNVGYGALVNAGLLGSSGELILILNADTELLPSSIDLLVQTLLADGRVGLVAPELVSKEGEVQRSAYADYRLMTPLYRRTPLGKTKWGKAELARFNLETQPPGHAHDRSEPDWVMGAALLVRRQAVVEVGPLDPRFWMYFEDVDWCRRFRQAGWSIVWDPSAQVVHHWGRASHSRSWLREMRNPMAWYHLQSGARYFMKHGFSK